MQPHQPYQPQQQWTDDGSGVYAVYARATPRLRALIRDLAVQFAILLCLVVPPTVMANQDLLRVLAPVSLLAFVFYEPVLIAVRGATLGHSSMNLRIVRARDFGRVSFPRALLRTVVKVIFGLPSFVAMYFTSKHQAIHDLVAGTVVVPREARRVRHPEWFDPARPEPAASVLPGAGRRIVVILGHWLAWWVMLQIAVAVIVPDECFEQMRTCRQPVRVLVVASGLIWFAGTIGIAFAGWKGALWGAQRTPAPLPPSPAQ
jgi:uncharacterized RDD family membrane protein YckC